MVEAVFISDEISDHIIVYDRKQDFYPPTKIQMKAASSQHLLVSVMLWVKIGSGEMKTL